MRTTSTRSTALRTASARTTAIAIPAVLLLLLSACAGGPGDTPVPTDGAEPDGATEALDGGEDGTECPYGAWSLDIDDLGAQLQEYLEESSGLPNEVAMDGEQRLLWGADGAAEFSSDLTITITSTLDDGLDMIITQVHSGGSSGQLDYADGEATPSGWDQTGYVVSSTVEVGGVPTESEFPVDGFFETSEPMQIGCDGGELFTYTEPSFVTARWVRES
jgi:hypothetical protein